jgi:ABC-type molybdate transport system permease subunit
MDELGNGSTAIAHAVLRMALLGAAANLNLDRLFLGLALLIAVGGGLAVLAVWWIRRRDPEVGPVLDILVTPPTDLPPAVVGALLDASLRSLHALGP